MTNSTVTLCERAGTWTPGSSIRYEVIYCLYNKFIHTDMEIRDDWEAETNHIYMSRDEQWLLR